MNRSRIHIRALLLGLFVVVAIPVTVSAQTDVDVTCTWDAPALGTPVDHYVLEHSVNNEPWTIVSDVDGTSHVMSVSTDEGHRIRVAGVDADGNQGPYSLPSLSYGSAGGDDGAPGAPGQPTRM